MCSLEVRVRQGEGASGTSDGLDKAGVGEKRDMQHRVTHGGAGGHRVSALVLVRQMQPTGVVQKGQRKMTDFHPKNTSVKTARGTHKK